jgi:putative ABC transport system permease protein
MFKNQLLVAFRNLVRKRDFSLINLIGLSIGLTCCLLIFQFVIYEYSFDRFHVNEPHLFRVLQSYARKGEPLQDGGAYTAQALAPALKERVPEVAAVARLHSDDVVMWDAAHPDRVFEDDGVLYADPEFVSMFSFSFLSGDPTKALQPGTALLSASAAKKYFGKEDATGEVLQVIGILNKPFTVTGVFEDLPSNSHLRFDILLPAQNLLTESESQYATEPEGGWSWNNFATFVQLIPGASTEEVTKKMTDVYLSFRGKIIEQSGYISALNLQPLTDIHLNEAISAPGNIVTGSYKTVYFFLVIGCITLVIALLNYINLATARAIQRAKEVGVRKAIGARKDQLVFQFLSESSLVVLLATLLALAFATALMPWVNNLAGTNLSITLWSHPYFVATVATTVVVAILLAGLYPAFVLSSFGPATVLKGRSATLGGQGLLRKSLVVVQFVACIFLIAGTVTVLHQINYMKSMELGLNLEQVLTVRAPRVLPDSMSRAVASGTFLQQISAFPGVVTAARSSTLPGGGFNWNGAQIRKAEADPASAIRGVATYIDSLFARVYGLQKVAGREFKNITFTNNPDAPWMVMINETASRALGYTAPADAVDQLLDIGGFKAQIIGVYKDFNWTSAHEARQSIVFGHTSSGNHYSVRLSATEAASLVAKIQTTYQELFPGNLFQYSFADETFNAQYQNDQRFAKLFSLAAGIAIFIACLGLLGIVAFTAQQRRKEIGMRKVLGASVLGIVGLLSKDFLKLIILGFVLSVPLTWYVMNRWLENFAYRVEVGVFTMLIAGVMAVVIALVTVSWQSLKAASANPVNSLRSE